MSVLIAIIMFVTGMGFLGAPLIIIAGVVADLIAKTGLSYATIAKLENGDNVQMEVLERICKEFKCQLSDIAEIIFD